MKYFALMIMLLIGLNALGAPHDAPCEGDISILTTPNPPTSGGVYTGIGSVNFTHKCDNIYHACRLIIKHNSVTYYDSGWSVGVAKYNAGVAPLQGYIEITFQWYCTNCYAYGEDTQYFLVN